MYIYNHSIALRRLVKKTDSMLCALLIFMPLEWGYMDILCQIIYGKID